MGGVEDHVHLVVAIPPTLAVSNVARDLKKYSSRAANTVIHPSQKFVWQEGYGGFTLNAFDYAEAVAYVHNQRQRHTEHQLIHRNERWDEEPLDQ